MKIPFQGELMKCVICGDEQKSDAEIESGWRDIVIGSIHYYLCPAEFPSNTNGSGDEFKEAYIQIFRTIINLRAFDIP